MLQKYLWQGILFKMADGSSGPFNGSDEAAAKAAGHDLKGSVHYSNCGVKELHVPLIALIDYKGFRMSAQAVLPLGKDSMVYGSAGELFLFLFAIICLLLAFEIIIDARNTNICHGFICHGRYQHNKNIL
jgi:hypothetical protein